MAPAQISTCEAALLHKFINVCMYVCVTHLLRIPFIFYCLALLTLQTKNKAPELQWLET